jgi:hypothetical protein
VLLGCELKHEVLGKAPEIAFYCLVQSPDLNIIQLSKVFIEDYLVAANQQYGALDQLLRNKGCLGHFALLGCIRIDLK